MTPLYIGCDNLIEWKGMKDAETDAYVNDATVTMTLKTLAGVAVTGAENVSLTYVTGSDGTYQGVIESTVSMTEGTGYYLDITVTSSPQAFRRIRCVARYKDASY